MNCFVVRENKDVHNKPCSNGFPPKSSLKSPIAV